MSGKGDVRTHAEIELADNHQQRRAYGKNADKRRQFNPCLDANRICPHSGKRAADAGQGHECQNNDYQPKNGTEFRP